MREGQMVSTAWIIEQGRAVGFDPVGLSCLP